LSSSDDVAKALNSVLKKVGAPEADPFFEQERNGVEQLVYGFLLWESTTARANAAYKRLADTFVDFNDLRVAKPRHITEALGKTYPLAEERAVRLLAALNEIYIREYEVSLENALSGGKREAKKYIDSLEGMTPFVSARITLYGAGVHAVPVDQRVLDMLIAQGVFEEGTTVDDACATLDRAVRAADGKSVADKLQSMSDAGPKAVGGKSKSGTKKTTKKRSSGKKKTKRKTKASGAS